MRGLDRDVFVFADVPYLLADHDSMVRNPRGTTTYDLADAEEIATRDKDRIGADGRLLVDVDGSLLRVGLLEKLLVPALAKSTNFVPDGDPGSTPSGPSGTTPTTRSRDPACRWSRSITSVATWPCSSRSSKRRRATRSRSRRRSPSGSPTSSIGTCAGRPGRRRRAPHDRRPARAQRRATSSAVRQGAGSEKVELPLADIRDLCETSLAHLDSSIAAGRRTDDLHHSYNRVSFPTDTSVCVDHLGPMLEGQVAALSSGVLGAEETLAVVDALYASGMYRR